MKKGCLIAVAVGLAFIAIVFVFAFALTNGAVTAGNTFLSQIGSGKIAEAYESASETFKSQHTAEDFEESVKKLGLADYVSASWKDRETKDGLGRLEGTATTRSGGTIPLHMELVKESGKWKVSKLGAPEAEVVVEPSGKSVPATDKLKAMALESLLAFNKAVKEKSFVAFQEQGSSAFRQQVSAEKLLEAFKGFVDQQIDISSIEKVQPIFDNPPAIDSDGVLILKGSYPTKPKPVIFALKYGFDNGEWRLQGIDVNVPALAEKPAVAALPSDEKCNAIVRESLMAFNQAIQEKSFAAFHKECSAPYREQISVEKLNEIFKEFMEKSIDISSIEKREPVFEAPPQVDSDGVLILSGAYSGKPSVAFKLKYVFEDDQWKIIGIDVKSS